MGEDSGVKGGVGSGGVGTSFNYPSNVKVVPRDFFVGNRKPEKITDQEASRFVVTEHRGNDEEYEKQTNLMRRELAEARSKIYLAAKTIILETIYKKCNELGVRVRNQSGMLIEVNDQKLAQTWVTSCDNHELTYRVMVQPFEQQSDGNTKRWSIESEAMRRCGFQYPEEDKKVVRAVPYEYRNTTGGSAATVR
jgi:hypothetical protein